MFDARTTATFAPPIMEARRWLKGVDFPPERPLLNVSQAAPTSIPPLGLRQALAEAVLNEPAAHLYGPVLGLPALREALAARWTRLYHGAVAPAQIAITSGCNQAYCAALSSLCTEGDEVVLPVPYYFNHRMWNDMAGIKTLALPTNAQLLPDPEEAAALLTPRTKAIVLVTPNNPGGVEYPASLVRAFYTLAQSRGIALILDETYRDFDSRTGPAHDLFQDPDWDKTLIQLYSFSKAYRLTGHRVGALTASVARLREIEKFLDTMTICPNQLAQRGALWGIEHLETWLEGERADILARRRHLEAGFGALAAKGWRLMGCGAYFAYLEHPFASSSAALAPRLVREAGLLLLPGTMFTPVDLSRGAREMRVAFANVDTSGIDQVLHRLQDFAG